MSKDRIMVTEVEKQLLLEPNVTDNKNQKPTTEIKVQLGNKAIIAKAIDSDLQTQLNDTRAELYNLYDS